MPETVAYSPSNTSVDASRSSLAADTIHLWTVRLDVEPALLPAFTQVLSSDELDRACRFRAEQGRRRFTVARGVLRIILAEYLGLSPPELRLRSSASGKPELEPDQNHSDVQFNVSHSHELALIAISRGIPVGVDIELLRQVGDLAELVERFFSPEEVQAFSSLHPESRESAFFACWTRKEAYLKATGEGLTTPLGSFAVSLTPGEEPRLIHVGGAADRSRKWRLVDVSPSSQYAAALAAEGRDWQLVRHDRNVSPPPAADLRAL